MTMLRLLPLLSLLPLAAACGEAAAMDPVMLTSACADGVAGEVWESAGWPPSPRCDWLPFDGRTTVELAHDLGRTPRDVSIYLSFDPDGHMSTPAAGDLARIVGVDESTVQLRNETNEDFFLKVVLR